MAIFIQPKNIVETNISRINNDAINSVLLDIPNLLEDYLVISSISQDFYDEKYEANKYYYRGTTKRQDFTIYASNKYISCYGQKVLYDFSDKNYAVDEILSGRDGAYKNITFEYTSFTGIKPKPESGYYYSGGTNEPTSTTEHQKEFSKLNIKFSTSDNIQNIARNCNDGDIIIITDETNKDVLSLVIIYFIIQDIDTDNRQYNVSVRTNLSIKTIGVSSNNTYSNESGFVLVGNELLNDKVYITPMGLIDNVVSIEEVEIQTKQITTTRIRCSKKIGANSSSITIKIRVYDDFDEDFVVVTVVIPQNVVSATTFNTANWYLDSVISITPEYDDVYYYSLPNTNRQADAIAYNIEQNYSNGKSTCVLNCSIDDYYDEQHNKVISKRGENGLPMTFKNNDIVYPKRMTMVRSGNEMARQTVDLVNGKRFRVVGVKVKYDGVVMQELTLQEEKID